MEHPEKYPAQIFRGICTGINMLTTHVELAIDLGFGITYNLVGTLNNLDLPKVNALDPSTTENHAAEAMQYRLTELIGDKPVLIISHPKEALKPMPPEWEFSLFYYLQDRKGNWHSVEDQLVREGHAAWLDPTIPVPTVE